MIPVPTILIPAIESFCCALFHPRLQGCVCVCACVCACVCVCQAERARKRRLWHAKGEARVPETSRDLALVPVPQVGLYLCAPPVLPAVFFAPTRFACILHFVFHLTMQCTCDMRGVGANGRANALSSRALVKYLFSVSAHFFMGTHSIHLRCLYFIFSHPCIASFGMHSYALETSSGHKYMYFYAHLSRSSWPNCTSAAYIGQGTPSVRCSNIHVSDSPAFVSKDLNAQ